MSYYQAKKSYDQKQAADGVFVYTCSVCMMGADKEDLSRFGARCWKCYDNYCKEAPHYHPQPQFTGDSRDWARRILHKEQNGEPVSKVAIQFAKEALRLV